MINIWLPQWVSREFAFGDIPTHEICVDLSYWKILDENFAKTLLNYSVRRNLKLTVIQVI